WQGGVGLGDRPQVTITIQGEGFLIQRPGNPMAFLFPSTHRVARTTMLALLLSLTVLVVAACGGSATPTPTATTPNPAGGQTGFEAEWAALIEAAKEEGQLNVLAGGNATRALQPLAAEFERLFGIEVRLSTGSSS